MRRAICMLLHEPLLAAQVEDVREIRNAEVAGADLLAALVETLHTRPDLTTGVLLEHFRGHEWSRWLDVLAHSEPELSEPAERRVEFAGCLRLVLDRAERRGRRRRIEELTKPGRSELSDDEKRELNELINRGAPGREEISRHGDRQQGAVGAESRGIRPAR